MLNNASEYVIDLPIYRLLGLHRDKAFGFWYILQGALKAVMIAPVLNQSVRTNGRLITAIAFRLYFRSFCIVI